MLAHLADASLRSFLLALLAALILWFLRSHRTAALQHAVWAAVVCGMLAFLAFGQTLPRLPLRILNSPAPVHTASSHAPDDLTFSKLSRDPAQAPSATARPIDWSGVLLFTYAAIACAFLLRFVAGMFLARRLLAKATPVRNFMESERIAVPLTIGWLRPRILLPLAWREWSEEKLQAVLAHEGAHASRHDGLVAAFAGVNRCFFWFHPLAWILERKLALLAELACDESCVALLGDRVQYARLLLEMAAVVEQSKGRLRCHALTMAAGPHIRRRIDSILREERTFSRGLTRTGWAALAVCVIPAVFAAGAALESSRARLDRTKTAGAEASVARSGRAGACACLHAKI
jgi:beta-lactamase regulating signal transducer with metallopeptidase domain